MNIPLEAPEARFYTVWTQSGHSRAMSSPSVYGVKLPLLWPKPKFSLDQVFGGRSEGRILEIDLLIPNIEFRIAPPNDNATAVNNHLLVSPDDPNHETEILNALGRQTGPMLEGIIPIPVELFGPRSSTSSE